MTPVSLLASVVAGALGGIGARIAHTWYKQHRRAKRLRKSIYTEVKANSGDIESAASRLEIVDPTGNDVTVPKLRVATTVYESSARSLGLLSSEEIEAVVRYYSLCRRFQRVVVNLKESNEVTTSNVSLLRKTAIELHMGSRELLQCLESTLDLEQERSHELERLSYQDRYNTKLPSEQFNISDDN